MTGYFASDPDLVAKQIGKLVTKLTLDERSRNAPAIQKDYEKLFWLCYDNRLDLATLLHEAKYPIHHNAA